MTVDFVLVSRAFRFDSYVLTGQLGVEYEETK